MGTRLLHKSEDLGSSPSTYMKTIPTALNLHHVGDKGVAASWLSLCICVLWCCE